MKDFIEQIKYANKQILIINDEIERLKKTKK